MILVVTLAANNICHAEGRLNICAQLLRSDQQQKVRDTDCGQSRPCGVRQTSMQWWIM